MAPNSTPSKSMYTRIDLKGLRRSSKSKADSCIANTEESTNIAKTKSHHVSDPRNNNSVKKSLTKAKKRSGFSLFKPFGCGQCRMRFIQMDQLQKHVSFHNKEKELISKQTSSFDTVQGKPIGSIKCCFPGCEKMFKTRKTLGNHIRRLHPMG